MTPAETAELAFVQQTQGALWVRGGRTHFRHRLGVGEVNALATNSQVSHRVSSLRARTRDCRAPSGFQGAESASPPSSGAPAPREPPHPAPAQESLENKPRETPPAVTTDGQQPRK